MLCVTKFPSLSHMSQSITVSYLLQFPVELSRSEGVHLGEVSPQQEHQAAIMDIQGIVMTVHLCGMEGERGVDTRDQLITPTHCQVKQTCNFIKSH